MSASAEAPPFRLRSLALPIYAPTFLFGTGLGMTIPLLPLFARELGASVAVVGLVVATAGIGTMASDVPTGMAVARFGARPVVIGGMTASVLFVSATAFATNALMLLALVLVGGAAWSMWSVTRLIYMRDVVPLEFRGRAVSRIGGVNRFGLLIGPLIGGFVGREFGLAEAFLAQAAITAAALVCVVLWFVDAPATEDATDDGHALGAVIQTLVEQRRPLLTAGVAAIALILLRSGRLILFPLWGDQIGLDVAQIGLIFSAAAAVDTALFYPAGVIMDRWGRKRTIVPSMLVLSLALLLIPTAVTFGMLLAVGLLSGLGNGLGSGAVMTLGADLTPRDRPAQFLGVWRLVSDAGAAAAPLLVGSVAAVLTLGAAAMVTAGAGLAGAAVMVLLVPETLRHDGRHR